MRDRSGSRTSFRGWVTVGALAVAAGCSNAEQGPRLAVSWTGTDTGKLVAPMSVQWCPGPARLEVMAIREDLGFGLSVYPVEALESGEYPAFDPGVDTIRRPAASGAARWFTEQEILGFQSDSGQVEVTRTGDRVSFRFGLRLRSLSGKDTVRATGETTSLVPGSCQNDSVPPSPPTL